MKFSRDKSFSRSAVVRINVGRRTSIMYAAYLLHLYLFVLASLLLMMSLFEYVIFKKKCVVLMNLVLIILCSTLQHYNELSCFYKLGRYKNFIFFNRVSVFYQEYFCVVYLFFQIKLWQYYIVTEQHLLPVRYCWVWIRL